MIKEIAAYSNLIVAIVIPILVCYFFLAEYIFPDSRQILNLKKNPNITVATIFWTIWWLSLIPFYVFADLQAHHQGMNLALLDIGNLFNISAAIMLCHGATFRVRRLAPLIPALILLLLWDILLSGFGQNDLLIRFIVIAPSAVLSHISIIAIGWAFCVRWGRYALPFLLLTIVYALLQLPAYVAAYFPSEVKFTELGTAVFFALALLKLPYAACFLGFLLSPAKPDFTKDQYWPNESVAPHKMVYKLVNGFISIVLIPILIGVVTTVVSIQVQDWVKSFFRGK